MRKTVTKEAAKSVKAAVKETSKDELTKAAKTRKAVAAKAKPANKSKEVVQEGQDDENVFCFMKGKAAIYAAFTEFQGNAYLNIREFYQDAEGEWLPTKKGFTVPADKASAFASKLLKWVKSNSEA